MFDSVVVALLLGGNSSAVQAPTFNHVRSEESGIRRLIVDGYARSATFRELVDAVEDLPCIVYIASVVKLSQGMSGALLHRSVGPRETPILRVLVRANLSRDETIAIIGHELRHVIEAVSAGPAVDGLEMTAAFDRLDPGAQASGVSTYETEAAIQVATKVRDELKAARRQH